jgi:hypothetical protein
VAYGDERVIVDVKDIKDGEILYTDKEGKQTTYYPTHSIWLEVQTLEVLTVLGEPNDGAEPPVSTQVRGTAALEDRSISVVGDPKSKVRKLTISFHAGDWKPKPVEPKEGEFQSFHSELGGAMLGFNRADWEIGNDDDWWISCYLPKTFIAALIADVRSGQLDGVKLSLSLRGLYTSSHTWEPVSSRGDLFIRPDRRDNSLAIPDMAQGHVRAILFTSSPRDLRKPEPAEPIKPEDEDALPAPASDPVAAAVAALSLHVDQLRSTLKWIGGFIVVALLFVASR